MDFQFRTSDVFLILLRANPNNRFIFSLHYITIFLLSIINRNNFVIQIQTSNSFARTNFITIQNLLHFQIFRNLFLKNQT